MELSTQIAILLSVAGQLFLVNVFLQDAVNSRLDVYERIRSSLAVILFAGLALVLLWGLLAPYFWLKHSA
jgi:hypothetical protein